MIFLRSFRPYLSTFYLYCTVKSIYVHVYTLNWYKEANNSYNNNNNKIHKYAIHNQPLRNKFSAFVYIYKDIAIAAAASVSASVF